LIRPGGIRTPDQGIMSPAGAQEKAGKTRDSEPVDTKVDTTSLDCDLARVVAAWPELPAAIRRAMLALIDSE
jgi:hypothetical protein